MQLLLLILIGVLLTNAQFTPVNLLQNGGCEALGPSCSSVTTCPASSYWQIPTGTSCGIYCSGGTTQNVHSPFGGWSQYYQYGGYTCVYQSITVSPNYGGQVISGPYEGSSFFSAIGTLCYSGGFPMWQYVSVPAAIPTAAITAGLAYAYGFAALSNGNNTGSAVSLDAYDGSTLLSVTNVYAPSFSPSNIPSTITWTTGSVIKNLPATTTQVRMFVSTTGCLSEPYEYAQVDGMIVYIYTSACIGYPSFPTGQTNTAGCSSSYTKQGSTCLLQCLPTYMAAGGNFTAVCNTTWTTNAYVNNNWVIGSGSCVPTNSESLSHRSHSHMSRSHSASHKSHSRSKSHRSTSVSHKSHSHSHSHQSHSKSHQSKSHESHSHRSKSHNSKSHRSLSTSHQSRSSSKSHRSKSESHKSKSHESHSDSRSVSHKSHSHHSKSHRSLSTSHQSRSSSKSHRSKSESHKSKSHESHSDSRSASHKSHSHHSVSHESISKTASDHSKSHQSKSQESHSHRSLSNSHKSDSPSQSHRSHSKSQESTSHESDSDSWSPSHESHSHQSYSHESGSKSGSEHSNSHYSLSTSRKSDSDSKSFNSRSTSDGSNSHHSPSRSHSHKSDSHSTSDGSNSHQSYSHQSESHSHRGNKSLSDPGCSTTTNGSRSDIYAFNSQSLVTGTDDMPSCPVQIEVTPTGDYDAFAGIVLSPTTVTVVDEDSVVVNLSAQMVLYLSETHQQLAANFSCIEQAIQPAVLLVNGCNQYQQVSSMSIASTVRYDAVPPSRNFTVWCRKAYASKLPLTPYFQYDVVFPNLAVPSILSRSRVNYSAVAIIMKGLMDGDFFFIDRIIVGYSNGTVITIPTISCDSYTLDTFQCQCTNYCGSNTHYVSSPLMFDNGGILRP